MRKPNKIKIQIIALSITLLISCICEPLPTVQASEPVVLKDAIDTNEEYETNFMVIKDTVKDDVVLKPVLEKPEEKVEVVEVVEEPEVIEEPEIVVEEIKAEPEVKVVKEEVKAEPVELSLSDVDLIALVVMAEAEGEPEEGKRLVADVILNRVDSGKFPNSVEGVVYQKGQFEAMWNGRVDRCEVRDDIRKIVEEEMASRVNSKVLYFRTNHYHNFGTPELSVGNHYFSS